MNLDPIVVRLREARQRRGWTQARVGDAAGVTKRSIAGLENGYNGPTLDTARRWAGALGFELTLTEVGPGSTSPEPGPASVTPALPAAVRPDDQLGVLSNLPPLPPKWQGEEYLSRQPAAPMARLITPCPYDTNADGDCGRRQCPHCGGAQ